MTGRREALGAALLLALGLLPRLAFVTVFPALPVSDFRVIVEFGVFFRDAPFTAPSWFWEFFSPGVPMALSLLFRAIPAPPDDVARLATAVVTGLVPLLPFFLWRTVLPLWTRLLAGAALALWPGQILFSSVVAQDNWVLPPALALACLAVRALLVPGGGWPVAASLLYAAATAARQEMLVVLLPLLAVAAGLRAREGRRRRLALCLLAAGVFLGLLAAQRRAATGRFALTTAHGGIAALGAYVPGSAGSHWVNPTAYVASVEPEVAADPARLQREAGRLALQEALRRPWFHAARMAATVSTFLIQGEATNLYWSLLLPGVVPAGRQPLANSVTARAGRFLCWEMAALQALFLAAAILAVRRRNGAILLLGVAILLKVGVHAVTVTQGRYYLAVTGLEILGIVLGCREAARPGNARLGAAALAAGTAAAAALFVFGPKLMEQVMARDVELQRTYRFTLVGPGHSGRLACVVERGRLSALAPTGADLETLDAIPSPGETAEAVCRLTGSGPPVPLAIRLHDTYAPGGQPDRMRQRVVVDGAEVFDHDLGAEPGAGPADIPVGAVGEGTDRQVLVQLVAVQPDPGTAWGRAAVTKIEIVQDQEDP